MDEFAGVVVFFVIIGLIEKFSKASKKNRNTQDEPKRRSFQRMPAAAKTAAARPAKAYAEPAGAVVLPASSEGVGTPDPRRAARTAGQTRARIAEEPGAPDVGAAIQAAKHLKARTARPKEKTSIEKAVEARILTDEEGCIGGSIAHTQHEGEGKAEHALHLEQTAQAAAVPEIRRITAADLRKAVVMSEILDKPVSMRGRRAS